VVSSSSSEDISDKEILVSDANKKAHEEESEELFADLYKKPTFFDEILKSNSEKEKEGIEMPKEDTSSSKVSDIYQNSITDDQFFDDFFNE